MTIQPMTFEFNQLNAAQKTNFQETSGTRKDDFSYALEQSKQKQEPREKVEPKVAPKSEAKPEPKVTSKDKSKDEAINNSSKDGATTKEVSEVKESVVKKEVSAEEETKKVIEAIANLLQITTDELEELLGTLQIGIAELLQGNNLQELMMKAHGLDEPMELLQIPKIVSDIKMITSILEGYETVMLNVNPEEKLLADTLGQSVKKEQLNDLETKNVENPGKNSEKDTDVSSEKSAQANVKPENDIKGLKADLEPDTKITTNVVTENSQELSQGHEQFTPDQDSQANQFMDNLTQSMTEVFQGQTEQVNNFDEIAKTVRTSTEVVDPRMVLDQIVEKIKISTVDEQARMNIQLKPEHLGKLSMEVVSKQGILTAQFIVENDKTKQMIEQNMQQLRESLESKGLVIQELEVTVGQNQNEDNQAFENPRYKRNTSDIISSMMNEEIEEVQPENIFDKDTSEVDFIA